MDAIAGGRLYVWNSLFGIVGFNNDLTVLDASPLTSKISNEIYLISCRYEKYGVSRKIPYWLSDVIYPKFPCFLHRIDFSK